jgi:arginine utilization protein RocB
MVDGARGSFEERARYFATQMVGWPSVTGSAEEALFADRLKAELSTWPIFRDNPADLVKVPAPGLHDRASVMALVRGEGTQTVILAGHFDTVSVDDYGELAHLAGEPEALRNALIAKLEASGANPLALDDLASGRFLPGRGMLDMKSGLAAGLAVLERFAASHERVGNLLLIACPDEEENSSGMRSVAGMLPGFLAKNGLDGRLTINLDAICDNEDGAAGRVVTMGCIGKLLLSALVVGKEAHACYPLDGVNAAYLAAELVSEMEYAPELGEIADGGFASPPTVLGFKDLKPAYNVTIPAHAWVFWNALMHRRKAAGVMAVAGDIAARAMRRAAERMAGRAAQMSGGPSPAPAWRNIPVLTYRALFEKAEAESVNFSGEFAALGRRFAERHDLDLPTRSRELVEFVWRRSGLEGPAVVLCIGSMPYPAIVWPEGLAAIDDAVAAAVAKVSSAYGESITMQPFFPAIADMSFVGPIDREDLREVAANTPLWGSSIAWPEGETASLQVPVINAGPWGRDYHHWLERTHEGYTFRVLPDLVDAIARRVLTL